MTIFLWLCTFATTILYKIVFHVPTRPLIQNRVLNWFSTKFIIVALINIELWLMLFDKMLKFFMIPLFLFMITTMMEPINKWYWQEKKHR
jgi:hypothetical protein